MKLSMSIKQIVRKFGGKVLYFLKCLKWYCFFIWSRLCPRKTNYRKWEDWDQGSRFLLIAPHADDELLSSYTLLKKCSNLTVYYCGFTGTNSKIDNRNTRRHEIESLCHFMGIPFIDGGGSCLNLEEAIKRHDVIVLPSIVDWHQEHRKVSYLLMDLLRKLDTPPCIYSYSVTVPNESCEVVLANSMNREQVNEKYSLFNTFYKSQRFMPIFRFKINDRINGYHINEYAAETFLYHPFEKWISETKTVLESESNADTQLIRLIHDVSFTGEMRHVRRASRAFQSFVDSVEIG